MDIKYGKNLQKGDIVGVAYNNYIWHAIFAGLGRKGNPNLYFFYSVLNSKEVGAKKIYKGFINRTLEARKNSSPIVKIPVDYLTDPQDQLDYLEVSSYLKQIGLI